MSGICSIDGCGLPVRYKGWCNTHLLRWKRHGDPLKTVRRSPASSDEERREWHREWNRIDYQKSKDKYLARARAQSEAGYYEKVQKHTYFAREDIKERARLKTREWAKANPDRKKAGDKAFNEANRALVRSYKAKRRAAERKAAPPWLTDTHREQIAFFYIEADRLSTETGIPHEVDHIIPLQSGCACGLHVPWNLRVITRDENNRRPRKWTSEGLTALCSI